MFFSSFLIIVIVSSSCSLHLVFHMWVASQFRMKLVFLMLLVSGLVSLFLVAVATTILLRYDIDKTSKFCFSYDQCKEELYSLFC